MSCSRLKYWSPDLLRCFRGAGDLFQLSFLDVPIEEMPGQILQHLKESDDDVDVEPPETCTYSQADRIAMKTVAVRIAALLEGGER